MARISLIHTICLFSLIVLSHQLPNSTRERGLPGDLNKLEIPEYAECPGEYYSHIKTRPSERSVHKPGHKVTLDCISSEIELQLKASSPGNRIPRNRDLIVYPERIRTCQNDDTWSSKPPVCTWIPTGSVPMVDFSVAAYTNIFDCSSPGSCGIKEEAWEDIGSMDRSCSIFKESNETSVESRKILYVFARHVYLSFILIPPTESLKNIKVRVKKSDVIRGLSEESHQLLSGHYESFRRVNSSEVCAVTKLPVFAREVLLELQYDRNGQQRVPDVEFITIPEPGNSRRGAWNGLGCPKEPIIRHSTKTIDRHRDRVNVTYTCHTGYSMRDPITQELSDGVLRCRNNFEWQPYPFPVCKKNPQNGFASQDLGTDDDREYGVSIETIGHQSNNIRNGEEKKGEHENSKNFRRQHHAEDFLTESRQDSSPMRNFHGPFLLFTLGLAALAAGLIVLTFFLFLAIKWNLRSKSRVLGEPSETNSNIHWKIVNEQASMKSSTTPYQPLLNE